MEHDKGTASRTGKRFVAALAATVALIVASGCAHAAMMGHAGVQRPGADAFSLGPRHSAQRVYVATLQPLQPLRLRRLQKVPVLITDEQGRPVRDAVIEVDGGMPEHGHGLPTQPHVSHSTADGVYEIEGLRFSMGGWWELKLAIDSPAGRDSITFNLDL